MIFIRVLLVTLVMALMPSCSMLSITLISPPTPMPTHKFLAGASSVDITPPPGYPMGGHSMAGKIGRGYWLRLNARSIFIEDPNGTRMALVSTDLWAMPAGLADRVAEIVSKGRPECVISRSGLIIAATHTHQSPANFSTAPAYNAFAAPLPGFDPDLFEFLAKRIALSIDKACQNRQEAEVYFNQISTTVDVPFARNRSFEAFRADPESEDILLANKELPVGAVTTEYPFPDSYRAVDPTIRILRIKQKDKPYDDIAIAAFLAVHNTSMTHEAKVYSSDLFGAASLYLENNPAVNGAQKKLVVAIFNGAEGDISPAWEAQDRRDTLRLGKKLAERIMVAPLGKKLEGSLNYRFESFSIVNKCFPCDTGQWGDSFACPETHVLCTAESPMTGVGALGGAEDGRTFFYYLGCREGLRDYSINTPHGNKRPMLNCLGPAVKTILNSVSGHESPDYSNPGSSNEAWLTGIIADFDKLPDTIPLGIYSIGKVTIATLPGEFTMVMGKRISDDIKRCQQEQMSTAQHIHQDEKSSGDYSIVLIGLANEYLSYFTTPQEYQMQAYEGASTLYGVGSGELVRFHLAELSKKLGEKPRIPEQRVDHKYHPGRAKHFGVDSIKNEVNLSDSGFTSVLLDTQNGITDFTRIPAFCWPDSKIALSSVNDISFQVTPKVRIVTKNAIGEKLATLTISGAIEDDNGLDFVSMIVSHNGDKTRWCTFWLVPDAFKRDSTDFYFVVDSTSGLQIESARCYFDALGRINPECRFSPGSNK
ncbi:MAG TPA: neutral/alkaline non-lysosomal ceramidase N-terminal domain-containing protein [Dissulfurispiraceae bacterium]|nr:neutral/alkaline non-lysosomal ceramidase N-terminal domain-containing protein [Dissulfurispiraceae bacterium]